MMKSIPSLIALSLMSAAAFAAGEHGGGHETKNTPAAMAGKMAGEPHSANVGRAGVAAKVTRTIGVSMDDTMRFTPDEISVKTGETIRFFVKNSGQMPHEMVIGSVAELKEHAEMMRSMPSMQHAESNMITLKSGQRGGLIWEFDQPGTVDIACLVPGHMEAGMVAKVKVGS